MTADKSLVERLRAHECTCGGSCGQQTPAYIREAADRLEALTAPVEMGLETTAEDRASVIAWLARREPLPPPVEITDKLCAVFRDADKAARLAAQLAAEKERADAEHMRAENYGDRIETLLSDHAAEKAAREKAEGALRELTLEEAAKWHDAEAHSQLCGDLISPGEEVAAGHHIRSARAIRALKETRDTPSSREPGLADSTNGLSPYHRDALDEQC